MTAKREEQQQFLRRVAAGMLSASGLFPPLNAAVARLRGGVVLACHSIGAAEFVSQVEALRPNRPVHLDEIVSRIERGKSTAGLFAITFDDGLAPVACAIVPELIRRGWPATFYLPTGYIGSKSGIPFQYWRLLADVLPRKLIFIHGARVNLSPGWQFDQFCAKMHRLLHTCSADA